MTHLKELLLRKQAKTSWVFQLKLSILAKENFKMESNPMPEMNIVVLGRWVGSVGRAPASGGRGLRSKSWLGLLKKYVEILHEHLIQWVY